MQNKRGQELTVGTLILIVLGVIILVLLVLGYSMGWSNLWERINIFQGGSSLESVIQSCKVAVSSASTFTYCQDFKKVKIDGKDAYVNCEYSTIASALGGSTLNCESGQALKKCVSLISNAPRNNNLLDCTNIAKVNDIECKDKCTSVNLDANVKTALGELKTAEDNLKNNKEATKVTELQNAVNTKKTALEAAITTAINSLS